jgi:hypothetical protein
MIRNFTSPAPITPGCCRGQIQFLAGAAMSLLGDFGTNESHESAIPLSKAGRPLTNRADIHDSCG